MNNRSDDKDEFETVAKETLDKIIEILEQDEINNTGSELIESVELDKLVEELDTFDEEIFNDKVENKPISSDVLNKSLRLINLDEFENNPTTNATRQGLRRQTEIYPFLNACEVIINTVDADQQPFMLKMIAATKLSDRAFNATRYKEIKVWEDMKKILLDAFETPYAAANLQIELNIIKMRYDETICAYNNRVEEIYQKLCNAVAIDKTPAEAKILRNNIREQALVSYINGLNDKLKFEVKTKNPTTFEQAMQIAIIAEKNIRTYNDVQEIFRTKNTSNTLTHKINIPENQEPIYKRPYRLPHAQMAEIDSQIKQMEKDDIIEPSFSPWNAPLLLVKKKLDASQIPKFRIVVDFRALNKVTINEYHPLPNITEILDQLGQCNLFSIIDLASGFYQIKLDEKSKELTAFSTNQGHWHFKKMAMGLKTSPCSFQRLMNNVMAGIVGIKCLVYLDDIIIYGKGLLDHNEKLRDVFERLRNHNLKIQPTKCEFLKQQCMYLGHIISENGIQPDPEKIKSVLQFPIPMSVKEIKSFLGLSGYYRKFIKSYSLISKPMTNLLRKDVTFNWDTSYFTKPFIVTTDASGKALGAILSQGEISQDLPIAYASRTLSKCEKIIANKVRSTILSQIKSATYYSILFDCTPDISHEEQMSQVIRYVVVNENGCEIVESFLGFIQVFEKTGESITEDILRSLSKDGIDLANCRGQSYDNGANMAGKWKGVQARISAINELARFIPCTAHSLNLVGLHAAKCSPELEKFFGIIQKLFNFFSSSTQRWDMLKKHLKFSLKGYSTTRWSAKYRAVKSLYLQLAQVIHTCNVLKNGNLCEEATVELNSLLKGITNFNFLCMLTIWNKILMAIDKVNVILQKQNISIDVATNHIKGLLKFIEKFREEGIDEALIESKQKATNLSIEPVFPSIRSRKKKKMPGELADDDISTISEESNFKILMKNVCDRISNGLKERFDSIDEAAQDFSFLDGKFLFTLPTIQLKKHAMDFCIKYEKDIDKIEFILELDSFTQHVFQLENKLIDARSDEILSFILKNGLQDAYPNIYTAYQIFLTLPVTSASCERSFSKLKIIKSYLRSTTKQRRLNNLSIISIEHEIAKTINYDDIINEFASKKARKVVF
ncbi:hypothetical protein QTP88_007850 [Uroleucon formosanum]